MDTVENIIAWEAGELSPKQEVEFFSELVKGGLAWQLQGMYGRHATWMIRQGLLDDAGDPDWDRFEELYGPPEESFASVETFLSALEELELA